MSDTVIVVPSVDDLDRDIEELSRGMDAVSIETFPFDKWDCYAIFAAAVLEVAADFLLGDPQKGLSGALSDKNSTLGSFLQRVHDDVLKHEGDPWDYLGSGFGGPNHRARTFGHDLLMLPLSVYMLSKGKFVDFGYPDGSLQPVVSRLNECKQEYASLPPGQAVLAALVHLTADFCSAKSLPVPGFGVLAHAPSRTIRKLVADMYAGGFNLRHVMVQGIGVACCEILVRVYHWLRTRKDDHSSEAVRWKLHKMLLLTHGTSAAVNIGKVVITGNPCLINLPMIVRVLTLVWSVARDRIELTHRAVTKANMVVLKTKLELMRTAIIMEKAMLCTGQIDRFINRTTGEIAIVYDDLERDAIEGVAELRRLSLPANNLPGGAYQ
jgi:hypothetical protein